MISPFVYSFLTTNNFFQLIEFEDADDSADLLKSKNVTVHDMSSADWYRVTYNSTADGFLAVFNGTYDRSKNITFEVVENDIFTCSTTNNICLQMRAHNSDSRAENPPRMLIQPSSISLRIILSNLTTQWEKSRFAIELIFASNDSNAAFSSEKAVSDEYSPGVFTVPARKFSKDLNDVFYYF